MSTIVNASGDQLDDEGHQRLAAELCSFKTIGGVLGSDLYRMNHGRLTRLLSEPRVYECEAARPRLRSFLRVAQWNIEYGACLDGIIEALSRHPVLRFADLVFLSEVDDGMARSGNRNVARELGLALRAHSVYAVEYLELAGASLEGSASGPNQKALHGNAILTRHPFLRPQVVRLPRCENNFESPERRFGGRSGLILDLDVCGARLVAAAAHLDVVNTPRCRGRQMVRLLEAIRSRASQSGGARAIIGGDLNTHTFARGGRLRALRNLMRVLTGDRERLARTLLHPEKREPALRELAGFGYQTQGLNDRMPTSSVGGPTLARMSGLPGPIKGWALKRVGPRGLSLQLRLDWLAGRGVRPLAAAEVVDEETGLASVNPQTIPDLRHNGERISDHDPIVADVQVRAPGHG